MRGFKQDIYEGGIRLPLVVRWKKHIPAGTTTDYVSGHEDWMPTLLELIGAKELTPKTCDGISFAPTLLGKSQPPRPFLYREFHGAGGQQSVRVGDWKLLHRNLLGTAKKPAAPTTELYNLAADRSEKKNVAAATRTSWRGCKRSWTSSTRRRKSFRFRCWIGCHPDEAGCRDRSRCYNQRFPRPCVRLCERTPNDQRRGDYSPAGTANRRR